jgi:hypothetical protein
VPRVSWAFHGRTLRTRAEATIERLLDADRLDEADELIRLLDEIDGDPDLEIEAAA